MTNGDNKNTMRIVALVVGIQSSQKRLFLILMRMWSEKIWYRNARSSINITYQFLRKWNNFGYDQKG